MTSLARPSQEYAESWAQAVREFAEDGSAMNGSGLWHLGDPVATGIERVIEDLRLRESAEHADDPVRVPCTYFWVVEDGEFLGYLALRHETNAGVHEDSRAGKRRYWIELQPDRG